jgi:hypothetical protein
MENYFIELNNVNVNEHVEQKNKLSYLSWAWAWAEVKKKHPDADYKIYENADGWNYHTDGRTGWVKTGVTVNGIEHIEYLPIMDFRNASIKLENITSFDVNKAIQRSLTKACARHGLGLYIYAGEDLPEEEKAEGEKEITDLKEKVIDKVKADAMISAFKAAKLSTDEIKDVLKKYGYTKVIDVKVKDYASVMGEIKA